MPAFAGMTALLLVQWFPSGPPFSHSVPLPGINTRQVDAALDLVNNHPMPRLPEGCRRNRHFTQIAARLQPAKSDARWRVATQEQAIPLVFVPLKAEPINTR
jgi:hypothetical protein